MVHVCGSEACAYVITLKQVLKSLCQLWAGSAYGLGLLRASKCTMTPLLHEGGFILPAAYRSLQGLLTRGLQKVATRLQLFPPCLFRYLRYAGKRREISKLKQQIKTTKPKNLVLSFLWGRTPQSEMSQFTLPAKELMSDFPSLYFHALQNILLCSDSNSSDSKADDNG